MRIFCEETVKLHVHSTGVDESCALMGLRSWYGALAHTVPGERLDYTALSPFHVECVLPRSQFCLCAALDC